MHAICVNHVTQMTCTLLMAFVLMAFVLTAFVNALVLMAFVNGLVLMYSLGRTLNNTLTLGYKCHVLV